MDWRAIHAARPEERKKVARKTRTLQPLTDSAIRDHLTGKQTIGVYPLLPDETCWFLAVDFDKESSMADAAAFASTCQRFQIPVTVERSRSGNGAHIWLFFDRPVLAANARQLGCALLTRTMENRHEIGLDSYDRLLMRASIHYFLRCQSPGGGLCNSMSAVFTGSMRIKRKSKFTITRMCGCQC
jgi:hypothetical protein